MASGLALHSCRVEGDGLMASIERAGLCAFIAARRPIQGQRVELAANRAGFKPDQETAQMRFAARAFDPQARQRDTQRHLTLLKNLDFAERQPKLTADGGALVRPDPFDAGIGRQFDQASGQLLIHRQMAARAYQVGADG